MLLVSFVSRARVFGRRIASGCRRPSPRTLQFDADRTAVSRRLFDAPASEFPGASRGWVAPLLAGAALLGLLVAAPAVSTAAPERVDINSATVEKLATLPGIGEAKAAAIVDERTRKPFVSVEDLQRVSGIGSRTVAELKARVKVGKAN